jgi:hypothetical protein
MVYKGRSISVCLTYLQSYQISQKMYKCNCDEKFAIKDELRDHLENSTDVKCREPPAGGYWLGARAMNKLVRQI